MSKKRNNKNKSKKNASVSDNNYGLQAIILADSYMNKRFQPISHDVPKCLIPLCGCPMINYSIDLLINSNVREIWIICSSHAKQIEDYINSSQWTNKLLFPKLTIHVEPIEDCNSVGSALRYMHNKNSIQSKTFVLCRGGCIANISLSNIIKQHQKKYKESSSTLMTCLFKKANYHQRSTSLESDLFIITDDNGEMIKYSNDRRDDCLSFDVNIFDDYEEIDVHHDIIDTGIDICSKQILSLFEDNFDYESIRKELFADIIRSEVYNYKIYAHILLNENEYASRILDWRSYAGVTFDIIERWTYPLVLDSNTISHNYLFERNNIYKEDNVKIGKGTKIKKNVILGFGTKIGNFCNINKTVIGSNCVIGNKCDISDCYLFGDCTIGNNTQLNGVVLANNVVIGRKCTLSKGCILSFGVHIDDNMKLAEYTKVTLTKYEHEFDGDDDSFFESDDDDDDDVSLPQRKFNKQSPKSRTLSSASQSIKENDSKSTIMRILDKEKMEKQIVDSKDNENEEEEEDEKSQCDTFVVGMNGKGYLYELDKNDDSFVMDKINNVLAQSCDLPSREPTNVPSMEYGKVSDHQQALVPEDAPIGNGAGLGSNLGKLISEISDCIENAEQNKATKMSDVEVEICTSLRLSHNCALQEFAFSLFKSILNRISENESVVNKTQKMVKYVEKYGFLLEKLSKKERDQMNVINGLYKACNTRQKGLMIFFLESLDNLYFADIVCLLSIQKWSQARAKTNDTAFENYLEQYIGEWEEADEEEDDDDDDDGQDSFSQSLSL